MVGVVIKDGVQEMKEEVKADIKNIQPTFCEEIRTLPLRRD